MNVLVIGNGFDIAHSLPTKYENFLEVFKNIKEKRFSSMLESIRLSKDKGEITIGLLNNHPELIDVIDIDAIRGIENKLENNIWAHYYANCEAEIKGWIDFEREMIPLLNILSAIFNNNIFKKFIDGDIRVDLSEILNPILIKKASLLTKYFDISQRNVISVIRIKSGYFNMMNGILKNHIINDLRYELEIFIECFREYLKEIVDKIELKRDNIIESIKADSIISFNYTNTEKKYSNFRNAQVFHIHGNIDHEGSMVLGINEFLDDVNNDFIGFTKFFQRIRKSSDTGYKSVISKIKKGGKVVLYGHSLDSTDDDIIKPLIRDSSKAFIYYYDDTDYEQKVINLIKMFDRNSIEEDMYNEKIIFLKTNEYIPSGTIV